jgi:hypothetical protein
MKDNVKVIGELGRLCGQPLIKIETDMKRYDNFLCYSNNDNFYCNYYHNYNNNCNHNDNNYYITFIVIIVIIMMATVIITFFEEHL